MSELCGDDCCFKNIKQELGRDKSTFGTRVPLANRCVSGLTWAMIVVQLWQGSPNRLGSCRRTSHVSEPLLRLGRASFQRVWCA